MPVNSGREDSCQLCPHPSRHPGRAAASQLSAWAHKHSLEADPATALRAVLAWSRLHGFVSLEITGNHASRIRGLWHV